MNTATKSIIATVTAVAIGTGVYTVTESDSNSIDSTPVDDVTATTVAVINPYETVVVPNPFATVVVLNPEKSVAEPAELAVVSEAVEASGVSVSVPDLCAVPKTVGALQIPEIDISEALCAELGIPSTPEAAKVATTGVVDTPESAKVATTEVLDTPASAKGERQINVEPLMVFTGELEPADKRLPLAGEMRKKVKRLFKDQRNISYDSSFTLDNQKAQAWLKIYEEHQSYTLEPKSLPKGVRMIAEVRIPVDPEVLDSNLEFYAAQGYNSVLLTFDGSEEVGNLMALASVISAKGLKVFFAYGGPEQLTHSVYIPPTTLAICLRSLAKVSTGFFVGWRRTSCHLLEQDKPFTDFMLRTVREANPNICVIGEGYLGATASSNHQTRSLSYNVPTNASGVLLVGVGYLGVNIQGVLSGLFTQVGGMDRLALVLGDRPYYATMNSNGRSFMENLKIKQDLERRFTLAGCRGTVTLHGDGSDGVYSKEHTDNLGKTARSVK